jgi:hypothetical protein
MFKTIVLAAGAISTNALLFSNDVKSQNYMWSQFKQEYNKKFDVAEDASRFSIFINNLKEIDARNARETNKVHGLTKFSDLTSEEFQSRYLGAKTSLKSDRSQRTHVVDHVEPYTLSATADWTGTYTTPVKDQGYCGIYKLYYIVLKLLNYINKTSY